MLEIVLLSELDPIFALRKGDNAHVFRDVVQDIWLQWHIYINRASDPAEITLSDIKDSIHTPHCFSSNLP